MLVVDPWHWLTPDGSFIPDNSRLFRRMLRIARFIEAGGPLDKRFTRQTLVECTKKPNRKTCTGMIWVAKTQRDEILVYCLVCKTQEAMISNWQSTDWADGPMPAVPIDRDGEVLN